VHTITFDNGKEFAAHQDIAHALKAKIFFARPYHAWERGLNENTNGLIRDFFPKGTDFSTIANVHKGAAHNATGGAPGVDALRRFRLRQVGLKAFRFIEFFGERLEVRKPVRPSSGRCLLLGI
jgi:hypothetical protein